MSCCFAKTTSVDDSDLELEEYTPRGQNLRGPLTASTDQKSPQEIVPPSDRLGMPPRRVSIDTSAPSESARRASLALTLNSSIPASASASASASAAASTVASAPSAPTASKNRGTLSAYLAEPRIKKVKKADEEEAADPSSTKDFYQMTLNKMMLRKNPPALPPRPSSASRQGTNRAITPSRMNISTS